MNNIKYIRLFRKCGITVNPNGSEDHEINIAGPPNYRGPSSLTPIQEESLVEAAGMERQFDSDNSDINSGSRDLDRVILGDEVKIMTCLELSTEQKRRLLRLYKLKYGTHIRCEVEPRDFGLK